MACTAAVEFINYGWFVCSVDVKNPNATKSKQVDKFF